MLALRIGIAIVVFGLGLASASPRYAWRDQSAVGDSLQARFPPPTGTTRVELAPTSFGAWLRELPLEPPGTKVHLFDGREKPRQDVHAAVVAIDVGDRDLQQCADAVMRLWAEYRYSLGLPIAFHPDPGKPRELSFQPGADDRRAFHRWLTRVFADAGSASLQAELARATGPVMPGDVLIQGGYPGHAVLVVDVATGGDRRFLLLAQSYMPAQQIHLLRNLADGGAWFDAAALDGTLGLLTPEWRPFHRSDVRRFR